LRVETNVHLATQCASLRHVVCGCISCCSWTHRVEKQRRWDIVEEFNAIIDEV